MIKKYIKVDSYNIFFKVISLIIWRLIELQRPIYFLLKAMAEKSTIKRRKKWLEIFNS